MRKNFPITELCEALGVSRSGYHNLGKREPSRRRRANEQLLHQIRIIHSDRHTRCYGSPRMTRELPLSELAARRIVSQESCVQRTCELVPGALSARRLPSPITRRILRPICYRKPGLLQLPVLSSLATSLNIPTREGWLYLAVVIDLFSRAILGWKLSDSLHADLVVGATTRAISQASCPREHSLRSRLPILGHHHPRVARPTWFAPKHERQRLLL